MQQPESLEAGQVLKMPLQHPVRGHVLLEAGVVLNKTLIAQLRRLGMADEALRCVVPVAAASPEGASPAPVTPAAANDVKKETAALQEGLAKGLEQLLDTREDVGSSMADVMGIVEALIRRLQGMDLNRLPDLRIHGGGELTHPINVLVLSVLIGIKLELSWDALLVLAQAALLHDVGKYRVSRRLLYKTGQLSAFERRTLERHVELGGEFLKGAKARFPQLSDEVIAAILAHHERWNGCGYPRGLQGERIPLAARILAVADAYDDMISDLVYRKRMLSGDACRLIRSETRVAFDPAVVEAFERVVVPYPLQALLRLSDGQVAQVVAQGEDSLFPIVQLGFGEGQIDLAAPGAPRIVKHILPRRHPRKPLVLPVALSVLGVGEVMAGHTQDLSLGGACVLVQSDVEPGTEIGLTLVAADLTELHLTGMVVWRKEHPSGKTRIGIGFQPLAAQARERLASLLNSRLQEAQRWEEGA